MAEAGRYKKFIEAREKAQHWNLEIKKTLQKEENSSRNREGEEASCNQVAEQLIK